MTSDQMATEVRNSVAAGQSNAVIARAALTAGLPAGAITTMLLGHGRVAADVVAAMVNASPYSSTEVALASIHSAVAFGAVGSSMQSAAIGAGADPAKIAQSSAGSISNVGSGFGGSSSFGQARVSSFSGSSCNPYLAANCPTLSPS
ncbi:MAG: hypothetical protein IPG19_01605 [Burkholderiales bacterium]|nr:hypothetical protein [Burkholderiales bacterium]